MWLRDSDPSPPLPMWAGTSVPAVVILDRVKPLPRGDLHAAERAVAVRGSRHLRRRDRRSTVSETGLGAGTGANGRARTGLSPERVSRSSGRRGDRPEGP